MLTQRYIWSGDSMVYECELLYPNNGTVYVYGINLISARNSDGDDIFYLYNAHGDVVQLVDGTGTITKTYNYDAFGVEYDVDEDDDNYFRYAGQYYDTETGTYYLRARYYNPANGRFTQQDSWEFGDINDPLSLNFYTYCINNPVNYYDPSGNWIILAAIVLIGLALSGCSVSPGVYDAGVTYSPEELKAQGVYLTEEDALNRAFDIMYEYANSSDYETGIYVYKKNGYYYLSSPYNSKVTHKLHKIDAEGKILQDPNRLVYNANPDAEIVAFMHTHPYHNPNIIFNAAEINQMEDYDYYVVDDGGCIYIANSESEVDKIGQKPVRKGDCWVKEIS